MKSFEELHPDLCPSPYCGIVNRYTREEFVDGHNTLVESWERDENGVMVDVLERDRLLRELADAKSAYENLLSDTY